MGLRRLTAATVIALMIGLAGCAPTPQPTPTPMALFAREEAAFAAAERAYRAYVEENNAARAGDAKAAPNRWLAGSALEDAVEAGQTLASLEAHIEDPTVVASVGLISSDLTAIPATVEIEVCVDVSHSHLIDAEGHDITSPNRAVRAQTHVTVQFPSGHPQIVSTVIPSDGEC